MFKVMEKNSGSLPKKRCASESGMCWVTGSLLTTYPPTIVRGDGIKPVPPGKNGPQKPDSCILYGILKTSAPFSRHLEESEKNFKGEKNAYLFKGLLK